MSRGFKGELILKKIDAYYYEVCQDFSYTTKKGDIIIIPAGLISDGASIPKACWFIIGSPFTGRYSKAAILHDFLYLSQITARKIADRIFFESMQVLGVSYWKRKIMYLAVRIGGIFSWKRHSKNLKNDDT